MTWMQSKCARRGLGLGGFCLLIGLLAAAEAAAQQRQDFAAARKRMVDAEIINAGITNPRVIEAMRDTPRHEFVPMAQRRDAYFDMALPIGHGQTISPPFIVAYMTEQIDPQPADKVLEIGTGSGYQAAVLSGLAKEVYTIEIVEALGHRAAKDLKRLKYTNVHAKVGDGFLGWPENAPFDKIIVTCSPEKVPQPLVAQLREGGKMIIPVGERYRQVFHLLTKEGGELRSEALKPTLFVPMTGEAENRRRVQPDPANPALQNGDFEEAAGDPAELTAWHYQRQLEVLTNDGAPSGKRYIRFHNDTPGRGAQALQGLAVDGRQVKALTVSLWVRAESVRPGPNLEVPALAIGFYDENRASVGEGVVGPWRGTFPWRRQSATIKVPPKAREAIVRIGLLGATGEISFDAVNLTAASN
jgi:protein-L-isoaspartate(D-aspartate) O-methyltransferase